MCMCILEETLLLGKLSSGDMIAQDDAVNYFK